MEAREIRMGNKVRWDYEIYTITAISTDVVDITRFGIAMSINIKSIQPIPLTEDWLLKFGFIKKTAFLWGKGDTVVSLKLNQLITADKIENENVSYHQIDELYYVHELQNVYFRLRKKEL